MKKEYKIKDTVWIHIGERKLTKGRVVDIFDLAHLDDGYSPDREFYVIEIQTGIDNIFEVRDFDQISPDASGPINLFRKIKTELAEAKRYLKKVGIEIPVESSDVIPDSAAPVPKKRTRRQYRTRRNKIE